MVNKVILLGNLGKDPVVKRLENGTPVATFSLATSESWKDKEGNKQSKTEWHNIVLWRGLAELAEKYLKKGDKAYIEGKLTSRSYEQEGVKKFLTEIVAEKLTLLGGGGNSNAEGKTEKPQAQTESRESGEIPPPTDSDDLPF